MKRINLTNSPSRRGHRAAFTLAEGATHVVHNDNSGRVAFTLAEVLITLGIIGVVAAMTLPTLIQQHQKQVYVTGLKKGVNTVQNMVQKITADEEASDMYSTSLFDGMCSNDEGSCEDAYGNASGLANLIPKYIKTVKSCTDSECDIKYSQGYFREGRFNYAKNDSDKYTISNQIMSQTRGGVKGYYSNDGMIYYFGFGGQLAENSDTGIKKVGLSACIDTNGEKSPNIEGRDLFCFTYSPIFGAKLVGGTDFNVINSDSDPATHIMKNGWKMDY